MIYLPSCVLARSSCPDLKSPNPLFLPFCLRDKSSHRQIPIFYQFTCFGSTDQRRCHLFLLHRSFRLQLWATIFGKDQTKAPGVAYQSSLLHHNSAVNVLRFFPSGEQLASGADGGELILWKLHSTDAGEVWKVLKSLAFHRKDVLDLQWSNDGAHLISGSVDNTSLYGMLKKVMFTKFWMGIFTTFKV